MTYRTRYVSFLYLISSLLVVLSRVPRVLLSSVRRDAKLKADAVANARASRLTGGVKTAVTRSKRAKP